MLSSLLILPGMRLEGKKSEVVWHKNFVLRHSLLLLMMMMKKKLLTRDKLLRFGVVSFVTCLL